VSRIIICPGYVRSKYDAEEHFISAEQLAGLYGVNLRSPSVVVYDLRRPETTRGFNILPGDVVLRPLENGDYPTI
jgi:hypothetical protein